MSLSMEKTRWSHYNPKGVEVERKVVSIYLGDLGTPTADLTYNLFVAPQVPKTNLGFGEFIDVDLDDDGGGTNALNGVIRVYNNTFVDLNDPTTGGTFDALDGTATNLTFENNVNYAPNLSTPVNPQGNLVRSSSGWTPSYIGDRWESGESLADKSTLDTSTATPANTTDFFELPADAQITTGLAAERDFFGVIRTGAKSKGHKEFD